MLSGRSQILAHVLSGRFVPLSNSLRQNRVQDVSQDCTDEDRWGWRIVIGSHSPPKLNLKLPLSGPSPLQGH